MANILIHGLNSKSGGGKTILDNFVSFLTQNTLDDLFFILVPNRETYQDLAGEKVFIVDIPKLYKQLIFVPWRYRVVLPRLISSLEIDLIFNLSDVPIPTNYAKQIFLLDWPYAVYPESNVWSRMDTWSWLQRKLKLYFFKKYLCYISHTIVQSQTMRRRFESIYGVNNIQVIPGAASQKLLTALQAEHNFDLPNGVKLLYPCTYFPHKNLEVLLSVASEIKKRCLQYRLILTVSEDQHPKAASFIRAIRDQELDDIIINVGPVEMKALGSLYRDCDAVLLPTLLETFGLVYFEAMSLGKIVLTSDFDFSRDACGDAAFYFNPFDSSDIVSTIEHAFSDDERMARKVMLGFARTESSLSWNEIFDKYIKLIRDVLESDK